MQIQREMQLKQQELEVQKFEEITRVAITKIAMRKKEETERDKEKERKRQNGLCVQNETIRKPKRCQISISFFKFWSVLRN